MEEAYLMVRLPISSLGIILGLNNHINCSKTMLRGQEGKAMQKACITCKYSFTCQTTGHGYRYSSTRWSCWKED
jgi:hypothetical protein